MTEKTRELTGRVWALIDETPMTRQEREAFFNDLAEEAYRHYEDAILEEEAGENEANRQSQTITFKP